MRSESAIWLGAVGLIAALGILIGFGASGAGVIALALVGLVLYTFVGRAMSRPVDAAWLPKWVVLGFLAKLAGTWARHWMVTVFYEGGDSYRYYRVGSEFAAVWRSGEIPPLSGQGGIGTQYTEAITGALFAVFTPDLLGGFVMFSILAYAGQLGFYAAFRRWAKPHQLKPYAILILLLPTYAFWPSSVGKDALMVFGLGLSSYFIARALAKFDIGWLIALGLSLGFIGLIRIHIVALVVGSLLVAALVSKVRPGVGSRGFGRILVIGGALAGIALVIAFLPTVFRGNDFTSAGGLEGLATNVAERTSDGGSAVAGGPVSSPADIPDAFALVLFRPFILEAGNVQTVAAALETTFLLALLIWRLPTMLRHWREWRTNAYMVFSTVYVFAFAIAFSAIRNLGIITRQRGQVLAFFLVIVIGLGWEESKRVRAKRRLSEARASYPSYQDSALEASSEPGQ